MAAEASTKQRIQNAEERNAYALGASLGRYMQNSLEEQKQLVLIWIRLNYCWCPRCI